MLYANGFSFSKLAYKWQLSVTIVVFTALSTQQGTDNQATTCRQRNLHLKKQGIPQDAKTEI
jgi:hypothetical protein